MAGTVDAPGLARAIRPSSGRGRSSIGRSASVSHRAVCKGLLIGLAGVPLSGAAQTSTPSASDHSMSSFAPALAPSTITSASGPSTSTDRESLSTESIVVKGQQLRAMRQAFSVTRFSEDDIRASAVRQTQSLLTRVPGLEVRNFGLGGVADAISLRGFSSGGHGGDLGLVLDGIPLNEAISHADGYADPNVIIPLELSRVDVLRGPVSALVGNYNRAGTIFFTSRRGGNYTLADLSAGSFGTSDLQMAIGRQFKSGASINLAMQGFRTDGFRPQSQTERQVFAGRLTLPVWAGAELSIAARFFNSDWASGSYLTAAGLASDPRRLDPRVQNDGGSKRFDTLRADFSASLTPTIRWLTFAYGTEQSFQRFFTRPVSGAGIVPGAWFQREETYRRGVWGIGTSLNGRQGLEGTGLGDDVTWVIGLESYRESTDFDYADGLNQRQRAFAPIYVRTHAFDTVSAFAESEWRFAKQWSANLGLRHDRFSGSCRVRAVESAFPTETNLEPCGSSLNSASHSSPKLAVRYQAVPGLNLRVSWAEGFQLAGRRALYSPLAGGIDPNVFRQTEVGVSWSTDLEMLGRLHVDSALWRLTSTNEIRTLPGANANSAVNLGSTLRQGLDLAVDWRINDMVRARLSWASIRSEITSHPVAAQVGQQVTAVPRSVTQAQMIVTPLPSYSATLTYRQLGQYAVNLPNTLFYQGYQVFDLNLSYRGTWRYPGLGSAKGYRLFLNLSNMTDRRYATSALVSAGTLLFAPAAPRALMLGIQADL